MRRNFFLLILLVCPFAFGISKVGNSLIGSQKTGFVTGIQYPFVDLVSLRNENLRMLSVEVDPEVSPGLGPQQSFIETKDFDQQFPQLKFQTRQEAKAWFNELGWVGIPVQETCIYAASISNPTAITTIAVWGPTKGAVFFGMNRTRVREALGKMLAGIELEPGACEW